jgi:hypothetical protein
MTLAHAIARTCRGWQSLLSNVRRDQACYDCRVGGGHNDHFVVAAQPGEGHDRIVFGDKSLTVAQTPSSTIALTAKLRCMSSPTTRISHLAITWKSE